MERVNSSVLPLTRCLEVKTKYLCRCPGKKSTLNLLVFLD